MRNLRCIVVDDEPLAIKMLEGYIARTPFLEFSASFTDPVLALSEIRSTEPDIVFLDIQMPDLSGMELSMMIPSGIRIIFTTAFKQYAFESYEVSALDFLLKPIRYQKFLEAAEKAREWFCLKEAAEKPVAAEASSPETIFLKVDREFRKVAVSDICIVEGMKDYVLVYLAGEKTPLVTHSTMKAMEDMLPGKDFLRIHRSHIIGLSHINSYSPNGDITVAGRLLHISDAYRPLFDRYIETLGKL